MPRNAVVTLRYGPYSAVGLSVEHRTFRLEGMQAVLAEDGHQVILEQIEEWNVVELVVNEEIVFQCDIQDLEFETRREEICRYPPNDVKHKVIMKAFTPLEVTSTDDRRICSEGSMQSLQGAHTTSEAVLSSYTPESLELSCTLNFKGQQRIYEATCTSLFSRVISHNSDPSFIYQS